MEGAQSSSVSIPKGIKKLNDSVWDIHSPEGSDMDIVFFHGLQRLHDLEDAAWKTWLARFSADVLWPKEWLSLKFPKARILFVSYNYHVDLFVEDLGYVLLFDIMSSNMNEGQEDRPMFLVGHSLGAIIIRKLIVCAHLLSKYDSNTVMTVKCFLGNLKGVFYYSSPHRDSRLAHYLRQYPNPFGKLLRTVSRRPMMELFRTVDAETKSINEEFFRACKNMPAASVAEGLYTSYTSSSREWLGGVFGGTAWVLYGIEPLRFMPADHFAFCRAENEDSPVVTELTNFIANTLKLPKSVSVIIRAEIPNSPVNTMPTDIIPKSLIMRQSVTSILDAFEREIEGGADGFFVSSNWLLSLEERESDYLMSVLWRAGYSEACRQATTILFSRWDSHISRESQKSPSTDIDEVGATQLDLVGTAAKGLTIDKTIAIAHDVGSENSVEASSSIDNGSNLVNTSPTEWQASMMKSFQEALKNGSQHSFCASTIWLSNLKDHEKEELTTLLSEAGYGMISQTKTTTWYERIQSRAVIQAGSTSDSGSSNSSNKSEVTSGKVKKSQRSTLLGFFGLKLKVATEDNTTRSSQVDNAKRPNRIKNDNSTCHAQLLRVECTSSTCQTPGERLRDGDFFRQEFDGTIGKWPVAKSQNISSTLEKSFKIQKLDFYTDERGMEQAREVDINLDAFATISLSCCIGGGHSPPQIRMKFSRISAEVKNKASNQELCNALVLGYLCTNVYSSDGGGQIILNLESEYRRSRGRVLAKDSSLVELGITPAVFEPGSTSLVLQGDVEKRRRHDSGRVHPLLFHEPPPAIFEGTMNSDLGPHSFLKFRIRHKLEIDYFRPCRPILEEGPVWTASRTDEEVDFQCCLEMKAENISLG